MLSGSRSCNLGSGGVVILRVVDGTTLPEIERPFAPKGTGGFRTPIFFHKNKVKFTRF